MSHYIDIRLRPDPEFLPHQLMDALFAKLHRQLVMLRSNDVGISFPQAGTVMQGLGPVMRLHAPSERLWQLQPGLWQDGMREMVMLGEVQEVPADAGHMLVRRVQAKSNPERIRRRQMKRKGWSEAEAKAAVPDNVGKLLKLPYLTVRSSSTGHAFRLFIRQARCERPEPGDFNAYGLSSNATLPMF